MTLESLKHLFVTIPRDVVNDQALFGAFGFDFNQFSQRSHDDFILS
jgi:hypothetical protein